ncbi:hypothetical protein C8R46DRAFT_291045 [Mycena filopes]|nr:hypothetical protein C8R46DRAFT_291045 [Mycena filopes]
MSTMIRVRRIQFNVPYPNSLTPFLSFPPFPRTLMWSINLRPISNSFCPTGIRIIRHKAPSHRPRTILTTMGPQIPPHRFWDFHIPKEAWDHQYRMPRHPISVAWVRDHGLIRDAVRTWMSIPDANLPSPWTRNWAHWAYWLQRRPFEVDLAARYGLTDRPLTGIIYSMFDKHSTVFASASSGKFYLYSHDFRDERFLDPRFFVFDGVFPTVEAFFDDADWNLLKELYPVAGNIDADLTAFSGAPHQFPPIRTERLRVAANEPYPRRTLWDTCPPEGAFRHRPRNLDPGEWLCDKLGSLHPKSTTWPHIPDAQLPAPWSCAWEGHRDFTHWYNSDYCSICDEESPPAMLQNEYGVGEDLVPAMFVRDGEIRGDMVLSAPGGAGTYYLWWGEERHANRPTGGEGALHRFHGTYADLEDFIRRADWNRLETIPFLPEEVQDWFGFRERGRATPDKS